MMWLEATTSGHDGGLVTAGRCPLGCAGGDGCSVLVVTMLQQQLLVRKKNSRYHKFCLQAGPNIIETLILTRAGTMKQVSILCNAAFTNCA